MVSPCSIGRKLQAEVDAGGDAAAGHPIAVDHDALARTGTAPNSSRSGKLSQWVVAR